MALFGVEVGVRPEVEMFCDWGENDRYLVSRQKINMSEFGSFGMKVGKFKDTKFYNTLKKVGRRIALKLPGVVDVALKIKEPLKKIVETVAPKQSKVINQIIDKVDVLKKPAQWLSDTVKRKMEEEMKQTEKQAMESNLPAKDKEEIQQNTSEAIAGLGSIDEALLTKPLANSLIKNARFIPLVSRKKLAGLSTDSKMSDFNIPAKRLKIMANSPASKKLNGEAIGRLFLSGRSGALKTKYIVSEVTKDSKVKGFEGQKAPDFENFFE